MTSKTEFLGVPQGAEFWQVGLQFGHTAFLKFNKVGWESPDLIANEQASELSEFTSRDSLQRTILHYLVCFSDNTQLFSLHENLSTAKDAAGQTPLHIAAAMGRLAYVAWVFENRPDLLLIKDSKERTAEDVAEECGHIEELGQFLTFREAESATVVASGLAESYQEQTQAGQLSQGLFNSAPVAQIQSTLPQQLSQTAVNPTGLSRENAVLRERLEDFRQQSQIQKAQFQALNKELDASRFLALQAVQTLLKEGVKADLQSTAIWADRAAEFQVEQLAAVYKDVFSEAVQEPVEDVDQQVPAQVPAQVLDQVPEEEAALVQTAAAGVSEALCSGAALQRLFDLLQGMQRSWASVSAAKSREISALRATASGASAEKDSLEKELGEEREAAETLRKQLAEARGSLEAERALWTQERAALAERLGALEMENGKWKIQIESDTIRIESLETDNARHVEENAALLRQKAAAAEQLAEVYQGYVEAQAAQQKAFERLTSFVGQPGRDEGGQAAESQGAQEVEGGANASVLHTE